MNRNAPGVHPLFAPRSIALVGATQAQHKLAGRRWRSLVDAGFDGPLYPVNPRADTIGGIPAYPSLDAIPDTVELVVIAVPATAVPRVAQQCVDKGARAVVVLSGGFAEGRGEEGRQLEDRVATLLADAGMWMIGPNCAGILSAPSRINLMGWDAPAGDVGVISQSGNIALNLGYLARLHGGGFSRIVSIGNARNVGVVPLLEFLLEDPATRAVIIYIEGWKNDEGRAFMDAVAAAKGRKPIILINPGRTRPGRRAAISHTGALAAAERIVDGVSRSLGVLRTDDLEVAWHTACQLARARVARHESVALLTDGGGHATLASDALGDAAMDVLPLDTGLRDTLANTLPPICNIDNPLDFAGVAEGQPELVASTVGHCLASGTLGAVVMAGHFGGYHRVGGDAMRPREVAAATAIADLARKHPTPVLLHSVHANESLDTFTPLRAAGVVVTASTRCLGEVTGLLRQAGSHVGNQDEEHSPVPHGEEILRTRNRGILEKAVDGDCPWLMEPESRVLLTDLGLTLPDFETTGSIQEARRRAIAMISTCPAGIVMKRIAPGAAHKSDGGGVAVGVRDADQVERALARFAADDPGVRILLTATLSGVELMVGGVNDPQFGPCVMLGAGGTTVELVDDLVLRPAPLSARDTSSMMASLRIAPQLTGYRGRPAIACGALQQLLEAIGNIMLRCPWIESIDLNPVMADTTGVHIADARVVLSRES